MFLGYQVNYAVTLPNFPPANITIRHIILLWTGDHPAQCEVCKTKGAEEKAAEDVIYVVSDGSFGQCKCRCPFLFSLLDSMY